MKIGKFEVNKKTIIIAEITFVVFAIIILAAYYIPQIIAKQKANLSSKIKENNQVFISKALEEFSNSKDLKPSEIAKKVSDELNSVTVNPFNKKKEAYTFEKDCKSCGSVEFDDELNMIILTTYNQQGELVARTVIKPPSFVTYNK